MHSFVDSGILPQLLVYVLSFVALAHFMLLRSTAWKTAFGAILVLLLLVAMKGYVVRPWGFLIMLVITSVKAYRSDFELRTEDEESIWGREFWMFVGSLLFLVSAAHTSFK